MVEPKGPMRAFAISTPEEVRVALRRARLSVGMSQNVAQKYSGVYQSDISAYERGDHVPETATVIRLLRAYRMRLTVVSYEYSMVFVPQGSTVEAETLQLIQERDQVRAAHEAALAQLRLAKARIRSLEEALRSRAAARVQGVVRAGPADTTGRGDGR